GGQDLGRHFERVQQGDVDRTGEAETDDEAQGQGRDADDQPVAQLDQVIEQGRARRIDVGFVVDTSHASTCVFFVRGLAGVLAVLAAGLGAALLAAPGAALGAALAGTGLAAGLRARGFGGAASALGASALGARGLRARGVGGGGAAPGTSSSCAST